MFRKAVRIRFRCQRGQATVPRYLVTHQSEVDLKVLLNKMDILISSFEVKQMTFHGGGPTPRVEGLKRKKTNSCEEGGLWLQTALELDHRSSLGLQPASLPHGLWTCQLPQSRNSLK